MGRRAASAGQAEQPKEAAIWTYVFACPSPVGDLELRLCMFERRRWFAGNMGLRFCMFQRLWSYGLTFMHVRAPAVIWTYVFACRSAGGHMDLRLCMFERRRGVNANKHDFDSDMDLRLCMFRRRWPYGLTLMHI